MSIPEIEPVKNHYGNNSATSFDFDFYIERSSQLKVQHTDLNGILTTLKENVDYSIHEIGNENGSYITFPIQGSTHSVLAWDTSTDKKELLTISLNLPLKQEFEFDISGDLDKHQLEKALDYQMRIDQILNRKINRAVLVPEGSELTPSEMIETIHNSRITAVQAANDAKNSANEAKEQLNNVNKRSEEVIQAYTDAKTDITNLKNFSVEEIKTEGAEQVDTIKKTGFYVQDGDLYCLDAEGKPKKLDTISDYSINNVHSFGDSKYVPTPVNNLSWLKSEGQQNAKAVYLGVYDWILENVNNGVEGFKRSTETYTDYDYVINTTDETFRLPLKNHSADDGNSNLALYYYVGETVQNPNLIDAGRLAENMVNRNLSNLSDFGKIMCAKNAFAQIHYDPNDFSKIGAYWAVQNLTSGSVNFPDGGFWLTFIYKYNAATEAGLINSVFELGIVPGGKKFTVEGNYPHYYFYGIRIQEA